MRLAAVAAFAVAFAALVACGSNTNEGCIGGQCIDPSTGGGGATASTGACVAGPDTSDYPCDVFAVVRKNCNPCHTNPPVGGAPFSLLTYEDTQAIYLDGPKLVFEQMQFQIQPGAEPRMPFGKTMSKGDFDTLNTWLKKCETLKGQGKGCGCPGELCK